MPFMLLNIILLLAGIIALVLIIAAVKPSGFRVERSATVAAPPAVVFDQVNNFRQWRPWSPWERLDPALTRDFSGPDAGVGAIYDWNGNREVGTGRMTIIESRPAELVRIKLEFLKPMAGLSTAEFAFQPFGGATTVTWSMYGTTSSFFCKLMSLFVDMDKMCGKQFEKGLTELKTISEAAARLENCPFPAHPDRS